MQQQNFKCPRCGLAYSTALVRDTEQKPIEPGTVIYCSSCCWPMYRFKEGFGDVPPVLFTAQHFKQLADEFIKGLDEHCHKKGMWG